MGESAVREDPGAAAADLDDVQRCMLRYVECCNADGQPAREADILKVGEWAHGILTSAALLSLMIGGDIGIGLDAAGEVVFWKRRGEVCPRHDAPPPAVSSRP